MKRILFFFCLIGLINQANGQNITLNVGDTFPNFQYRGMFQKENRLSGLKGSYVLIHFWSSWNVESREMQLEFIPIYSKYKEKKFKKGKKFYIISFSLDEEQRLFDLATKKDNLPWSSDYCDFKVWNSELVIKCGIKRIPSNFLLNPEGKIIAINVNVEELEQLLRGF